MTITEIEEVVHYWKTWYFNEYGKYTSETMLAGFEDSLNEQDEDDE